jgi:DnaJ family protein C protein 2
VLRHHPDKKASDTTAANLGMNTNDDAFFKCIAKAHETLTNPERRRQFDSVDPAFLEVVEDVPTEKDFKSKSPPPFLPTFAPIFERESRFSRVQPVPGLAVPVPPSADADDAASKKKAKPDPNDIAGHDFPALKAHVEHFYDFWYNFDSWRSFEWLDKEVNEGSDSRDDKRYTEKKNKSERARRKKEDIARVRGIVDLCLR